MKLRDLSHELELAESGSRICLGKSFIGVVRFQAFLSPYFQWTLHYLCFICVHHSDGSQSHLSSFLCSQLALNSGWLHSEMLPSVSRGLGPHPQFQLFHRTSLWEGHPPCLPWKVAPLSGNLRCCSFSDISRKTLFSYSTHETTEPSGAGHPPRLTLLVECVFEALWFSVEETTVQSSRHIVSSIHCWKVFYRMGSEIWEVHLHFYCHCLESWGGLYLLGTASMVYTVVHVPSVKLKVSNWNVNCSRY